MGSSTARFAICHRLLPQSSSSSAPTPNTQFKSQPSNIVNLSTHRRQFLFFSLPVSLTIHFSNSSAVAAGFDPVSPAERESSAAVSRRVDQAVEMLERAKELQAQGDFYQALAHFTQIIEKYKDFALSDYARVGRAIALYEVGDRGESIAEMEDVSISLKGYPEVHAALAAALYTDRHALLLAENQFTIATLLDPHYTDISYVRETKHWPPSLIASLQHFITLS
ncbi:uncharacterized protein LOC127800812 [Diospyros lotus]|uniref:uncharacterized protein LOC127800812 n=1 Tax=Diospyros lotus TaxID=55363 RepID=UPI0022552826|nr:uncharacterized protein LOC127800812 [Diospyros lotus]